MVCQRTVPSFTGFCNGADGLKRLRVNMAVLVRDFARLFGGLFLAGTDEAGVYSGNV